MVGPVNVLDDLVAERDDLLALLDGADLQVATPAPGWTIHDQVTHLAWFDESLRQAIVDPEAFLAGREEAIADVDAFVDRIVRAHRDADAVPWLRRTTEELVATARPLAGSLRVPWYGPEMSLTTAITARLMETWAHGQDVADALGVERAPTPRLRHVALLGARTLPNSFRARGRPVPDAPVRVELGDIAFGPEGARNLVRGPILDFCLVVTQRRNVADTALQVDGPVATEWMAIAQAFAGPPGVGR